MLIVAKAGGRVIKGGFPSNIIEDVKKLTKHDKFIFVHGGGSEVTAIASKLGKTQSFVTSPSGFRSRYTDKETIDIYTMVMGGKLNKQIVVSLQLAGVKSIGLSGIDGLLIKAKRKKKLIIVDERGRKRAIDGGYTGKIVSINAELLHLIMEGGYTPVVSPVAISEEFEPLNVDGDRAAAYIAGFLKADRLVFLTDVEGLYLKDKFVPKLSFSQAKKMLRQIGPGMITKVYAAIEALSMGVEEVIITSGLLDRPISDSFEHKCGTVISYG